MKTDGLTIAFMVTNTYNGQLFFDYNGDLDWTSSTSSTGNYIFWIETEGGEIVDVESTAASMVYSRSPGGGVLAGYNSNIYYYMPDYDGDNIGTEDNCPDVFNPDQSDYNANGLGDACDEDDDSDGVLDFNDLVPEERLAGYRIQSTTLMEMVAKMPRKRIMTMTMMVFPTSVIHASTALEAP